MSLSSTLRCTYTRCRSPESTSTEAQACHSPSAQIDRTGEGGRGLATAGLVVGIIFTAVVVLYIVLVIVAFGIIATYPR